MRRRQVWRALGFALAFVVAACGGGGEPSLQSAGTESTNAAPQAAASSQMTAPDRPPPGVPDQASERNMLVAPQDKQVVHAVRRAFAADVRLSRTALTVDARSGVVTLRGTVGSEDYRDRAVAVARSAEGVTGVRSEIHVAVNLPARPAR